MLPGEYIPGPGAGTSQVLRYIVPSHKQAHRLRKIQCIREDFNEKETGEHYHLRRIRKEAG